MSAAIPSDQFLLYAFGDESTDLDRALDEIRGRARSCADLTLRIVDEVFWRYPVWASRDVGAEHIVVHNPSGITWEGCLAAVAALTGDQLDAQVMTWRLHVFPVVEHLPGVRAHGVVAVLQICHALGDGMRSSALAGHLFGRAEVVSPVLAPRCGTAGFVRRAVSAHRAHRRLVRETATGLTPGGAAGRPALRTNTRPDGPRHVRTVICERRRLAGPTVTVHVLAGVSAALSGHLRELGEDPAQLGAEIPMSKPGARRAHNHFGNVGIGLHPEAEIGCRVRCIATELRQRRRRATHPAMRAADSALAAMPAAVLRWGVAQFDPDVRATWVTGNTVVSSVNRGAGDLRFGPAPVLFTAGFPSLSPMMGLTHGVHGIGDAIAVSVHAAESAIGDIDAYMARLESELRTPV